MRKYFAAGSFGFVIGLVLFAVGREIVFDQRSWPQLLSDALHAVGRLGWIDTTLVTGLAAVTAAYLSIRAVRDQIRQERALEDERRNAKLYASRSVLSISLSNLCEYATTCAQLNHSILLKCGAERLPRNINIPKFPLVPDTPIAVLKEMVELSSEKDGMVFARLASKLQVQSSRLRGMHREGRHGSTPSRDTIETYIIDSLEIYARCTALFDYARFKPQSKPGDVEPGGLRSALNSVGIFSSVREDLAHRCQRYEDLGLLNGDY
jgi:hypothetical protein